VVAKHVFPGRSTVWATVATGSANLRFGESYLRLVVVWPAAQLASLLVVKLWPKWIKRDGGEL